MHSLKSQELLYVPSFKKKFTLQLSSLNKICLFKVIGNDYGENMRPLPGMVGLVPAGSKVSFYSTWFYIRPFCVVVIRSVCFWSCMTWFLKVGQTGYFYRLCLFRGLLNTNEGKYLIWPDQLNLPLLSIDIHCCNGFYLLYQEKKKIPPAKGSETKRTRRDRRELENILFKLFERQPNWALKALIKETDQPEVFFFFLVFFPLIWKLELLTVARDGFSIWLAF